MSLTKEEKDTIIEGFRVHQRTLDLPKCRSQCSQKELCS